jgi:hypothetical protein
MTNNLMRGPSFAESKEETEAVVEVADEEVVEVVDVDVDASFSLGSVG